jgi:hypothetical protein
MYTFVFMVGSFPSMNSAKYQFFPKHLFDAFPIQWENRTHINLQDKLHTHLELQSMNSLHLRKTQIENKFVVPQ